MSLDLFQRDIEGSLVNAQQNIAPHLPAGFSETFDVALRMLGEWHNSNAYEMARERALASYYDDVKARTGEQLPLYGVSDAVSLDDLNLGIARVAEKFPDQGYLPLTDADVDTMARRRMAKAHADAAAMAGRETTWGGTLGTVLGMTAGIAGDPVTIATLPLGGIGNIGIALRALEFAAIAGGTEAATAAMNFQAREAAVPGSSKEIPGEIAAATLFGGALGAGFGLLGKLLKTGDRPLPTAAREEVNAAASEAQLNATNPFPTVAGEAAARDATVEAATAIARGEPVKAADNFSAAHVDALAAKLEARSPEELAARAERELRPETWRELPDVERFDPAPNATEDAASYWERWLVEATPEERAAVGATDADIRLRLAEGETVEGPAIKVGDKIYRGQTHSDALDRAARDVKMSPEDFLRQIEGEDNVGLDGFVTSEGRFLTRLEAYTAQDAIDWVRLPRGTTRSSVVDGAAPDLTPEQLAKLAAEPDTEQAVLRNLDRIRAERRDLDYPEQVRMPDGSVQIVSRKLEDVMDELDQLDALGKELAACATGFEQGATP